MAIVAEKAMRVREFDTAVNPNASRPELSVVVLRRIGWSEAEYRAWSRALLRRGEGFAVPSAHDGEPILRLCIVNTRSTAADIAAILDSMR